MAESLNQQALANIAEVLQDRELTGEEIIDAVMEKGYRYRPYVASMVQHAFIAGKLIRTNHKRPFRYRVVDGLDLPPAAWPSKARQRVTPPERRDTVPAIAPVWSATGPAPSLVPSIGLVCEEEVMPPEVARIFDSLGRRFHEMFSGVE